METLFELEAKSLAAKAALDDALGREKANRRRYRELSESEKSDTDRDAEAAAYAVVRGRFVALRERYQTELDALLAAPQRLGGNRQADTRAADLREAIRQIDVGADPAAGLLPELYALATSAAVRALALGQLELDGSVGKLPGLATFDGVLAELRAGRDALAVTSA